MEYYRSLKNPSVSKSIRLPFELWETIQGQIEAGIFPDFSSAVRTLVEGGLKLIEIKDKVDNPDEVKRLADDWNFKMNENDIFEWAHDLSDNKMKAVYQALDLEKERRYKS